MFIVIIIHFAVNAFEKHFTESSFFPYTFPIQMAYSHESINQTILFRISDDSFLSNFQLDHPFQANFMAQISITIY